MALIIAEIGTSHGGSEEKAAELVDAAVEAGAYAVKFQWVYADEILHPDTGFVSLPSGNIPLYDRFRQLEKTADFYASMCRYVRSRGREFICSPFGKRSLTELLELEPDAVKIASPELNHIEMLEALAGRRAESAVPVILSSGVSKLADIETALGILGTEKVSLLHCITCYPAPEEEYNLRLIGNLGAVFGVETGVSDHSLDPVLVPCLSVACGGTVIEKHITLSRRTSGLDDPVALEPEQFALMVHEVRQCEAVLRHFGADEGERVIRAQLSGQFGAGRVDAVIGDGVKRLAPSERMNYGRTNRSLHYMRTMHAGDRISAGDIAVLRTEKVLSPGISPEFAGFLEGKALVRDVVTGAGVSLDDFVS